jgi:tyrosine-protein phosphatase SIW14
LSLWRKIGVVLAAAVALPVIYAASGGGRSGEAAIRPGHWARPVASGSLENWYQLNEDVYRSEQPTRQGFVEIRERGVRTVVSLRIGHTDEALAGGLGLRLVEVPMRAPTMGERHLIAALRAIREAPKPVLFHCHHGSDRAGAVAAMYRIVFEGWTKEEAIEELKGGGFGFHRYYVNIPRLIRRADVEKIRAAVER